MSASEANDRARREVSRARSTRDTTRLEPALAAAAETRAAVIEALDAFEQAEAAEVKLRPHQTERRAAAGRTWLRRVMATATGGGK